MSINDIQNELNSLKTTSESTNDFKTIKDVLRNNIENIEKYVDSRVINIYSRPWNKLEERLKKRKIEEYLTILLESTEIDKDIHDNLLYKLHKEIEFNKKIKLEYDETKCEITKFDYTIYL
jgi:hypothetical protein